ncbi:hypothetical protein IKQ21_05355, partial [bacterium]|nr:hypothetical protein [bacterium]
EAIRNYSSNSDIKHALNISKEMNLSPVEIEANSLSESIEKILKKYENKELPQEEYNKIIKLLTDKTEASISEGIKEDMAKLLKSEPRFITNTDSIVTVIKENIPASNKAELEKIFLLSTEEIDKIVKNISDDTKGLSEEQVRTLKSELRKLFAQNGAGENKYYKTLGTTIINKISESIKTKPANYLSEKQVYQAIDFAKIIGDFKAKEKLVDSAALTKFEEAPQTMLARAYEKFENTLFDVLDIKFKEIKQMRESDKYAREILETKLEALTKDETKYQKAIKKLSKVMSEMEVTLHGNFDSKSNILDLVNAMENVYNNTAKRLQNLDDKIFSRTIHRLVEEDASKELTNSITSREELFKFLNGTLKAKEGLKENSLDYATENARGVGSAKKNAIDRIVNRYQGVKNSFNRILLSMDVYKRGLPQGNYESEVARIGREYLLHGSSSQFTQKFNLVNNPELYRDVMFNTFDENKLAKVTEDSFVKTDIKTGNVLESFKNYIKSVRDIMGNNDIDFTKMHHVTGGKNVNDVYTQDSLTRLSKFNLVAQDPVTMVKKAAERKYGSALWLRKAAAIGAAVLGVAVLAQFSFGKIKNPHNIQKQVSDDKNS